jgi:putative endonuclease
MKTAYVYILATQKNGTLYIGVTSNLTARIYLHKKKILGEFTKKYNIHKLVYYEQHQTMYAAITREKQLKKWNRLWKLKLSK